MSESTYVLKARWSSEAAAQAARPKVEAFFERMNLAYDAWQRSRMSGFEGFKSDYADVLKMLGLEDVKHESDIVGELDSPFYDGPHDIRWNRAGLRVMAEVWSGADWTRLCEALKKAFGAEVASWREARLA